MLQSAELEYREILQKMSMEYLKIYLKILKNTTAVKLYHKYRSLQHK